MTVTELLLVINDIHQLAIKANYRGGYRSTMQEIEQIAENVLLIACSEEAHDTEFTVVDAA